MPVKFVNPVRPNPSRLLPDLDPLDHRVRRPIWVVGPVCVNGHTRQVCVIGPTKVVGPVGIARVIRPVKPV